MGKHCKSCTCKNTKEVKYAEYPCEYCGILCKKQSSRALCSLPCRLMGNVKKENGCMVWQGKIGIDKYGLMMVNKKRARVHRISYETFNGPIPEDHLILHLCDNPPCINPKHLFSGTHEDNMYYMVKKGRSQKGNQYTRRMRIVHKD